MIEMTEMAAAKVVAAAVQCRRVADRAEAELLVVAAHWADLHAVLPGAGDAACAAEAGAAGFSLGRDLVGAERLVPLAGAGTPHVAEFAPGELGAALGMTSYAAACLIGDSLELRHRLPRVWAQVQSGRLQAWRARKIAQTTMCLSAEAAAFVDAHVAPIAHKIGLSRVLRLVEVAIRHFQPDLAEQRERQAADGRGVWVSPEMTDGTMSVRIEADALDVQAFDATLDVIADALAGFGDVDVKDVRRSKAVGVIADPQATLDLITAPSLDDPAGDVPPSSTPTGGRAAVTLYVHLSDAAVTAGTGTARVEGLGPATLQLVRGWLGRSDLTITPVLDLADRTAVDAYEPLTGSGRPCCCGTRAVRSPGATTSPGARTWTTSSRSSHPQTADHPARPQLICSARCADVIHRYKTHSGWTYTMPEPGIYLWRSPTGRHYLVDHTGTQDLADLDHAG